MYSDTGAIARGAALRLLYALGRYLEALAGHHPGRGARGPAADAPETGIHAARYSLRFLCGVGRMGRIMAVMDDPYPQRFMVGRLQPGGGARLCEPGALLLCDYLACEGLLEDVLADLEEAVALSLPARRAACGPEH